MDIRTKTNAEQTGRAALAEATLHTCGWRPEARGVTMEARRGSGVMEARSRRGSGISLPPTMEPTMLPPQVHKLPLKETFHLKDATFNLTFSGCPIYVGTLRPRSR